MVDDYSVLSDSGTQIGKNIFESEEKTSTLSLNTKLYFKNEVDLHSQVTYKFILV